MGLSGSDPAVMQARAGLARAGATRADYYAPNVIVKVNGTERQTPDVLLSSIDVVDRKGAPSEADLVLQSGTMPTRNQRLIIALGRDQPSKRLFNGAVTRVSQRAVSENRVHWAVHAVDDTRLLDARPITFQWQGESATTIALQVLDAGSEGAVSGFHVQADLPTIADFAAVNEAPSSVLDRLAILVGAHWKVDSQPDLHFYLEEPFESQPPAINNASLYSPAAVYIQEWDLGSDIAQYRSRVLVEGQSATVPGLGVPAGATSLPLMDDAAFDPADLPTSGGGIVYTLKARLGTQQITYTGITDVGQATHRPIQTTVDGAVAVGATSIAFVAVSESDFPLGSAGWVMVDDQVIRFTNTGVGTLLGIPASGYGSVAAAIESGAVMTQIGSIEGIPATGDGAIHIGQPQDTPLVLVVQVDDSTAQASLGVFAYPLEDSALGIVGAAARGLAELEALGDAIDSLTYTTRDKRTRAGRTVSVSLTGATTLSGSFPIQDVQIHQFDQVRPGTRPSRLAFPVRRVTATPVRFKGLLDVSTGLTPWPGEHS